MAYDAHANLATSLVATAPSPASSGTSLVVSSGTGTLFPAVPFNCIVCPPGVQPTTSNAEIVRVTTVSTDTFTITRTQESTSARAIAVGDQIFNALTKKSLTDIEQTAPQMPTAQNTQMLWGAISSAGATSTTSSGGFTSSTSGTGLYTITFTTNFKDTGYSVALGVNNLSIIGLTGAGKAVGSVGISTANSAGTASNLGWQFVIIGAI